MSRRRTIDYDVGYSRPPRNTQFSATNQPKRSPRYAQPVGKQMIDLDAEDIPVTRRGGIRELVQVSDVIAEALVAKAINGDLPAMREVYAQNDAEEDAAAHVGDVAMLPHVKAIHEALCSFIAPYFHAAEALERAGLIEALDGTFRVTPKAKQAVNRRNCAG